MSDATELHLEPAAQQILSFMQQHPEKTYSSHELAEQIHGMEMGIRAALAKLERLGYIDRGHTTDGAEEYFINPSAPKV